MIQPTERLAQDAPIGTLELVATFFGAMPTGVSVSHTGRIFVNFPKWGDDVAFTVAELVNGEPRPYPSAQYNRPSGDADPNALISVQSIVVDPRDRLWILDTGSPQFRPTTPGGPKLVGVDLQHDQVFTTIVFPPEMVRTTTYLNDVRFDLRRGPGGTAFITDSSFNGPNGLIVVDLASGESWRRLHDHPSTKPAQGLLPVVEGMPLVERPPTGGEKPVTFGSDGIAVSIDGSRLYYCPLASRQLYSVSVDALCDRSRTEEQVAATVVDEGDHGGIADGLESDAEGRVYATSPEYDAILRRRSDGTYETVAHDPRILWPDTMSLATNGYLYFTANQLHRQAQFHRGKDLRQKPYCLFRVPVDAHPVLLQ
jgi:sugar lactone lactonase YvrE